MKIKYLLQKAVWCEKTEDYDLFYVFTFPKTVLSQMCPRVSPLCLESPLLSESCVKVCQHTRRDGNFLPPWTLTQRVDDHKQLLRRLNLRHIHTDCNLIAC